MTTFVDEGLSLERCARRFDLNKSTLWRLVRVRHGIKPFKAKVIFYVHFALQNPHGIIAIHMA